MWTNDKNSSQLNTFRVVADVLRAFMVHLKHAKYFIKTATCLCPNAKKKERKEKTRKDEGIRNVRVCSVPVIYLRPLKNNFNPSSPRKDVCKLHQNDSGLSGRLVRLDRWQQLAQLSFVMSCWFPII